MKDEIAIYLAGKIQKAHENPNETYWTEGDQNALSLLLSPAGVEVKEWIHPFVEGLSDVIVESLQDGAQWIKDLQGPFKGPESIHEAMQYYLSEQFPNDLPMAELAKKSKRLNNRFSSEAVVK